MKSHSTISNTYFFVMALLLTTVFGCSSNAKKEDAVVESADKEAVEEVKVVKEAPLPKRQAEVTPVTLDYTVCDGDSLWSIAAKESTYTNPYAWPLIYKNNKSLIKDADLIFPGQTLMIDTRVSGHDIDMAVKHAKQRGAWKLGVVEESDILYLAK